LKIKISNLKFLGRNIQFLHICWQKSDRIVQNKNSVPYLLFWTSVPHAGTSLRIDLSKPFLPEQRLSRGASSFSGG